MITALRIEVNVIAALILLILFRNSYHIGKRMPDEQLYRSLLIVTFFYSMFDMLAWIFDGTQSTALLPVLYFTNIMCYLFCVIVPFIWCLYVEFRLFEDEQRLWKVTRFLVLPVIVYSLLVIFTPATKWMFSFDEHQVYQRGPLFLLQVVLSLLYAIYPTVRALYHLKSTSVISERRDCYAIAQFILFPLVGLLVQVFHYGIPSAIIAIAIAELMIFINVQNKQISLDPLTGINNRGQFNRYLNVQTKKEFHNEKLYMLLLDIDRFKKINDLFGHKVGDQALIDMAAVLQRVCAKHGGFLCRYGGDEFAIVIDKKSDTEIAHLMQDIQAEVLAFNGSANRPYQLSVSVGYAVFGTDTTQTMDRLIEAADQQMYLMKAKLGVQR